MAFSIRTPFIIGYIANKAGEVVASPEFIRLLNSLDSSLTTGTETNEDDSSVTQNVVVFGGDSLEAIVQPGQPVYMVLPDVVQPAPCETALADVVQPGHSEPEGEMVLQQSPLGTIATENAGTNFSGDLGGMTTTVVNGIITSVV